MSDSTPKTILLVSGLSGAGKTTALKTLEDMGWEVVDNLPLVLLDRLLDTPLPAGHGGEDDRPLALGIDAIAHAGALEAKGKTIAVMGNGLDNKSIHPRSNFELSQEIIRNGGLLLSEYPLGTSPLPGSFPARNRIMAGMSLGTLVVEAAEGSGSLITANLALDFNREVFAVPGPIFHLQSQGPHSLIKKGAKLVSSVSDILEEISFVSESKNATENPKKDGYRPATEEEKSVLDVLGQESVHVDTILKLSKLETATALSTLSMLEIKGIIKNMGGQNYIKL